MTKRGICLGDNSKISWTQASQPAAEGTGCCLAVVCVCCFASVPTGSLAQLVCLDSHAPCSLFESAGGPAMPPLNPSAVARCSGCCAPAPITCPAFQVETGSAITWKYPSVVLKGDNSVGEFYSVALTNNKQQASRLGSCRLPAVGQARLAGVLGRAQRWISSCGMLGCSRPCGCIPETMSACLGIAPIAGP